MEADPDYIGDSKYMMEETGDQGRIVVSIHVYALCGDRKYKMINRFIRLTLQNLLLSV